MRFANRALFQCPLVWAVRCKPTPPRQQCPARRVSVPSCLGSAMQVTPRYALPADTAFQCPLVWAVRCKGTSGERLTCISRRFSALLFGQCDASYSEDFSTISPIWVSVPSCLGSAMQDQRPRLRLLTTLRFQCPLVWAVRCKGGRRGNAR